MTNKEISQKLKLAAQLMELHGENPFKIRSYQTARETIGDQDQKLADLSLEDIQAIDGIGKGMAANIHSMNETGTFESLAKLQENTPDGVVEMLSIAGFGPKKIWTLWQEGGAESVDQLYQMCLHGQVAGLKGFAEKSQETLKSAIEFLMLNRGKHRYANVESLMEEVLSALNDIKSIDLVSETGDLRRRMDVIEELEFLVGTNDFDNTRDQISALSFLQHNEKSSGPFTWRGKSTADQAEVVIRFCDTNQFYQQLMLTTGSMTHLNSVLPDGEKIKEKLWTANVVSEEKGFERLGLKYIEPEMREGDFEIALSQSDKLPQLVEMSDLKGILHNHSTYSDGRHTLRQMAEYCRDLGYEYLGITDHSRTAVYASGLEAHRVKEQQEEINQLNAELAPFKIFSGIESDILNDGSLDYEDDVLASFDFIVASIHSGLSMDINKATNRLLGAIHNPYTTILGHMTGRLLLERAGYPVDHKAVIDACAEKKVIIEINASPYRLDIDWRWVHYAIEKGVMLSINPDAHKMEGYQDMKYGLLVGRKGGLTKEMTLNSMSQAEIQRYFDARRADIKVK